MGGAAEARNTLAWRCPTIGVVSLSVALAVASSSAASGHWRPIASGFSQTAQSDAEKTVAAGIYSKEQAAAGKKLYSGICSSCHLENLSGDTMAPALVGEAFMSQWENKNLRAIYSRIISTMPPDDIGSLTESETLTLVALVLRANGYSAGPDALARADDLNAIIVGPPPAEKQDMSTWDAEAAETAENSSENISLRAPRAPRSRSVR